MDYKRFENESDEELIYRICSQKEQIGSWNAVADILNSLCNTEYTESKFRKQYQAFNKMFNANQYKFGDEWDVLDEIKRQRRELEKEKVKFRDERNEYNRIIREQARKESFDELLKDVITSYQATNKKISHFKNINENNNDNDVVVHLTDIHYGINIDNYFNTYNENILKERLGLYLLEITKIKQRHKSENCYIILGGDLVSGIIHSNLRLENNKNVIEQTIEVCEIISSFIYEITKIFSYIYVGLVNGNHSRCQPQKELNAKGENFENFVLPYIKLKLKEINNISFISNFIDESIGYVEIRENSVFFVHGDKDTANNVVSNLTLMINHKPDIVFMGHRHTNALKTIYNTKVIESGCVSGTDNYCIEKRLYNYPEQTVSVISKNGLDCLYDITLYKNNKNIYD